MVKLQLKGYIPAVTTTFNKDGSIDMDGWITLLNWLHQEEMHGFAISGSTGEWFSMSLDERKLLFENCGKHFARKLQLIEGCYAMTIKESVWLAGVAAQNGFDAILITVPPYLRPNDREALHFFTEINKYVNIPIIIYNWPIGVGNDLSTSVLKEISRLDKVVAIKNSTPDLKKFIADLEALKDDLLVFGAMPSPLGMGLMKFIGGEGTMGAAGVLGKIYKNFYGAFWSNDYASASKFAAIDNDLMSTFFKNYEGIYGHSTATFKAFFNERGLPGGYVRSPMLDLEDSAKVHIRNFIKKHNLPKIN
ncbi:MAG: dihydrodipicolinate synthase family protein [Chitinophagaceae bacterium]|nr:dihydrodipicolinate synthase family protein [Chitinophagaceae bacterium]